MTDEESTQYVRCPRCHRKATHLVKNYWEGDEFGLIAYGPDLAVCEEHARSTITNVSRAVSRVLTVVRIEDADSEN